LILSPLAKLAVFMLLVGIVLIIILSFIGNDLFPASAKYSVAIIVIVLYAIITAALERHRRKALW